MPYSHPSSTSLNLCRECSASVRYTPLLTVLRLAAPIVTCLESRGAKYATSWSWISVSPSWLRSSDSPLVPEVTPISKIKELMSESLCVLFGLSRWLETPKQCSELLTYVSRTAWRILHWRVRKICLALAMLYRTRGTLHEKWDTETRYTFRTVFCVLFHFDV